MPFSQALFGIKKHASSHADGGSDEIAAALNENALSLPSIDAQTIVDAINVLKTGLSVSQAQSIINSLGKYWDNPTGLKKAYKISDDVLHSHDTTTSDVTSSDVKVKEITIEKLEPSPCVLRTYFQLRINANYNNCVYGRIWRNGSAYGTNQSACVAYEWKAKTEDLEFEEGDKIQLYLSGTSTYKAQARYFRILGKVETLELSEAISYNTVGVENDSDAFSATNTYP